MALNSILRLLGGRLLYAPWLLLDFRVGDIYREREERKPDRLIWLLSYCLEAQLLSK